VTTTGILRSFPFIMSRYYGDLSAESSSECSSADSEDDVFSSSRSDLVRPRRATPAKKSGQLMLSSEEMLDPSSQRIILHMDVDCFYCQCECLFRKIPVDRPLAIGQKHIVVTCNYAAREVGVTKLQLRDDAVRACPHLLIVEGSDLERYRIYARQIYQTLRRVCKELHPNVSVAKGSMDEAMVDLTPAVVDLEQKEQEAPTTLQIFSESSIFVCNHQGGEDILPSHDIVASREAAQSLERRGIVGHLHIAAKLALLVRNTILEETGFTTTFGVSSNPLLSKISSGLRKPGTVNILYPWRGAQVVRSMGLRAIPGLGRGVVGALRPCLNEYLPGRPPDHKWTCW
jgi:DNA polymerase iota